MIGVPYNTIMVITFTNGKGGTGKTTLSVLLALALKEAGRAVAIHDTDLLQKTATRWSQEVGGIELAEPGKAPITIVDTPPRLDSAQTLTLLRKSDVIILVTSPSPADLFTSQDTAALIRREGLSDRAYILYNRIEVGTVLARDLEAMAAKLGLPALASRIHHRQAYQHAVLVGWKALGSKAREETLRVALEITAIEQPLQRLRSALQPDNRI